MKGLNVENYCNDFVSSSFLFLGGDFYAVAVLERREDVMYDDVGLEGHGGVIRGTRKGVGGLAWLGKVGLVTAEMLGGCFV